MKKKTMSLVLAAMMAATLFGCGSNESASTDVQTKEQSEDTESDGEEKADASGTIAYIQKKGTLIVCTDASYAPYSFIDTTSGSTEPIGIDVELAQMIADKLGVELVLQPTLFKDSVASVTTGTVDMAINGMTVTDERKESLDFSEPYITCEDGIIIKKDTADQYKTLEDFKGAKLSANTGSPQALKAKNLIEDVDLLEVDNIPASIMEIEAGNTVGIAVEKRVGQQYVMAYDDLCFSEASLINDGEVQSTKAVGFAKGTSQELIDLVNEVIEQCVSEGKIDEWLDQYSEIAGQMVLSNVEK